MESYQTVCKYVGQLYLESRSQIQSTEDKLKAAQQQIDNLHKQNAELRMQLDDNLRKQE